MYKKILIATDGSEIAGNAVNQAIALAKSLGAKLTAVMVTEPYEAVAFTETLTVVDRSDYKKQCGAHADQILSGVAANAKAAGIECDVIHQDNHWRTLGAAIAQSMG